MIFIQALKSFFCWGPFPVVKYSISTRICYLLFVVTLMITVILIREDVIPKNYKCSNDTKPNDTKPSRGKPSKVTPKYDISCDKINFSFIAVYEVGTSSFYWFLLFALIHILATSSRDCRANLHYGFWLWKILIMALTILVATESRIENLDYHVSRSYYFTFVATLIMIGLQFHAAWILIYMTTVVSLQHFKERPKLARLILAPIGVLLYGIPVVLGLMGAFIFKNDDIPETVIYWLQLFISYAAGLTYSIFYAFKNVKHKMLLGGVFPCHVAFVSTTGKFQNTYQLTDWGRTAVNTMYYPLHYIEIIMAIITLIFFSAYGFNEDQPNMENVVIVVEENVSDCCCWTGRREVDVITPEGAQIGWKRVYKTTDPFNDEYTRVRYTWTFFYLLCGIFILYFSGAILDWYEVPIKGEKIEDLLSFHGQKIVYTKFAGCFFIYGMFSIYVFAPKIWDNFRINQ